MCALKPCPFCGNSDIEIVRVGDRRQSCIMACGWCGCRMESHELGYGEAWNSRTEIKVVKKTAHNTHCTKRKKASNV
jgi:Lar family restriction alleviation protein